MPNTPIPHLTNGTNFFGRVLQNTVKGIDVRAALSVLKQGRRGGRGGFDATFDRLKDFRRIAHPIRQAPPKLRVGHCSA